jgi:hypothetical protein
LIDIDVLFQGQRGVEHALHSLQSMLLDGHRDLAGMRSRLLDNVFANLILAAAKQQVVRREIRVAEHVGRHQYIFRGAVALGEIGATGITWEHHFEQA